jgi:hypothetical protein
MIGNLTQHWASQSPSGWMMEDAFEQYLELLRHDYPDVSELNLSWTTTLCTGHEAFRNQHAG